MGGKNKTWYVALMLELCSIPVFKYNRKEIPTEYKGKESHILEGDVVHVPNDS